MRALLRPGGLLFLTTGNAAAHRGALADWSYVIPEIHVSFFEPRTLARAMAAAGFRPQATGFGPGHSDIIRFKVLKNLRVRTRSRVGGGAALAGDRARRRPAPRRLGPPGGVRRVRRVLITGGAGFIGSNLADRLLADGLEVVVYDNFATGQRRFVEGVDAAERGEIVEGDVLDAPALRGAMAGCDTVFHLAANADVRFGLEDPSRDFEQNTVGTFTVLEAMRAAGMRRILFASSGSVYGEPEVAPTPEDAPFPVQTSLYAASKLAGEGMIQAYCEGYGFTGVILRFVSVLGERYTHGHLFDFSRALREDPEALTVLGDGRQRKSYLYVGDCVEAIAMLAARPDAPGSEVFNLGTDEVTDVDTSVRAVTAPPRREPAHRVHRRRARLDRRQPPHPPRLLAPAGAGLAAAPDDRRGRRAHARAGSTPTSGCSARGRCDERDLHARAAAHLARRGRHRPALLLPLPRRLPDRRARSTSTSTCSPTRSSSSASG